MDTDRFSQPVADAKDSYHIKEVRRVLWVGLCLNVVLTGFKFVAGIVGRSQAVVADAVHSLSDLGTDVMLLVGLQYWSAPADADHPYGHRRIETAVTTLLGLILAAVGVGLGYKALVTLHTEPTRPPGAIALVAVMVSIVSKEALYRWSVRVGKKAKSSAMVANAWHHRSDALSSIPPALAVGAAYISPTWSFLDHIGAVMVALFILQAAWRIMRPALSQLVDVAAPRKDREKIEAITLSTKGVKVVHAIRTRYIGSGLGVDLHIMVDSGLTVREGHDISKTVERRLVAEGPDVLDVVVHLEPHEG